jgi:FlaA1/EpsC-like NDP-sugar epimerase
MRRTFTDLPRLAKSALMLAADVLVLPLALWSAVALRLGDWNVGEAVPAWAYVLTLMVSLPIFLHMGLYRAVVRYLESRAFSTVIGASLLAAAVFALLVLVLDAPHLPRTALAIYAVMSAGYVVLARLLARQWLSGGDTAMPRQALVIYGAGSAGRQLLQALRHVREFLPVAWVDDNPQLHGRSVMGLRVHAAHELPELVRQREVGAVVVAIPSLSPGRSADLLRRLEPLNVRVRMLPRMADLVSGSVDIAEMRDVSPEDLLGRDPVQLDTAALGAFLTGKVVMVTGAGGSIGSELCRQLVAFRPRCLVLFEMSEFALYTLREELVGAGVELVCAVGDVKNADRVDVVMRDHRPEVVFHAAAYKHVPLMEEVNAWEAVRNNTWGTYVVGRAAVAHGVVKFVLVSTDKAVNPTNVMGATKRLAEMVCQALNREGRTRFETVRFGNVLGSSGSVIPKFRSQIARGGPITVTHPDIVRYFMSIPEAAQLVLQAGCMGQGGEVFVLDMGEPVRIVDLARNMIRLSGRTEAQIPIEFTGLRPGEKLYEELLADSEFTRPTHHPKIRVSRVAEAPPDLCAALIDWVNSSAWVLDAQVRAQIALWLPEYSPWRGCQAKTSVDECAVASAAVAISPQGFESHAVSLPSPEPRSWFA